MRNISVHKTLRTLKEVAQDEAFIKAADLIIKH